MAEEYKNLSDEEIIELSKAGSFGAQEYLLEKYKNLVRAKARSYFLLGSDYEDIVQEGMIGLYKALRDFDVTRGIKFHSFAEICVVRQILTAVRTATREKHKPLNSYLSLNQPEFEDDDRKLIEKFSKNEVKSPEELFLFAEARNEIAQCIKKELSNFEQSVLYLYLSGKTYSEISEVLNKTVKSIDNALQRIRRKLSDFN